MGRLGRKPLVIGLKVAIALFGLWLVLTCLNELRMYRHHAYLTSWPTTFKAKMEKEWHMQFSEPSDYCRDIIQSDTTDAETGVRIQCSILLSHPEIEGHCTMHEIEVHVTGMDERVLDKVARDLLGECSVAPLGHYEGYRPKRARKWVESALEGPGSRTTTIGDAGVFVWSGRTRKVLVIRSAGRLPREGWEDGSHFRE